jgi:thioredoxin-like negative regulator of GroEL
MNKNIVWILLIFLVPIAAYWGLTREQMTPLPAIATTGDEVIKFSSPMCYECQELDKVFEEVFPKYDSKVSIRKIDVTKKDKDCKSLIKEYNVTLVPTTVFKNQDGTITRRIEGTMQSKILDNYLTELVNK